MSQDLGSSQQWLRIGHLRFEKCELKEAQEAFRQAFELAKTNKEPRALADSIVGMLRFSGEGLDIDAVNGLERELDALISGYPNRIPPMVWYGKGAIATYRKQWRLAQAQFRCYLRAVRADRSISQEEFEKSEARAYAMVANTLQQRGHLRRAKWFAQVVSSRYESKKLHSVNGTIYLLLGQNAERCQDYPEALKWYQKAHAAFLEEHNWYHHLYVLYGYARIYRLQQNFTQAAFYLDLIDKAASGAEFGMLRRDLRIEHEKLANDSVDLLIDSRSGLVKTRSGGEVSLRKQYVLLEILRELSKAHNDPRENLEKGLTKAQIISRVWKENYRPEAHDNKLYYNINRLRRLIEPDMKQPKYLQNFKEGYRLAPGLRVHFLDVDQARA